MDDPPSLRSYGETRWMVGLMDEWEGIRKGLPSDQVASFSDYFSLNQDTRSLGHFAADILEMAHVNIYLGQD